MNLNFYRKRQLWKPLLLLCMTVFFVGKALASAPIFEVTVTGRVTSENGDDIPGVNVLVKGTLTGTITGVNGEYSIKAPDNNAVLIFSYVGYDTQEIPINGRSVIDVSLLPSIASLNEVVVTALGIKREERSLGYSVGRVNGDDVNRVVQENILSSLAGKVSGVNISSTGGTGSSVNIVIRGAKSLSGSNQPLFVIDGVPVINSVNNVSQIGSDNRVDYGNPISDINPDDVESVSVLKGANAAALYGSRAGNGVIIITTKSGSKAKRMTVSVSTNTVLDIPYKYLKFHSKFATGIRPYTPDNNPYEDGILQIEEGSAGGVGPELDKGYNAIQWNSPLDANGNRIPTPLVSHKDNIKNFVQTGITSTNNISVANNTDLISYRLSYTNMNSKGIIPNSDLFRNSLALAAGFKVSEKIKVSSNLDFTRSNSNNRPAGNRGTNPLQWAYAVSPHIDIRDLKDYWVKGQEGLQQRSQAEGDYNNPYFLAYEVNNSFVRDRVLGNMKADWQITPELSLMGRYSMDTYTEERETKIGNSYTGEPRGAYGIIDLRNLERNADFLLTYAKNLNNFSVTASAGGNARYYKSSSVINASKSGTGLITPGLYTIQNIAPANLDYGSYRSQKGVYSIYGLVNVGYKDMVYLDLTARNDWSSTLPQQNRSYFYPSASVSLLVNEMLNISDKLNLFKIRGSVAQVGNDTEPYRLIGILDNVGAWNGITRLSKSGGVLTADLKPEQITSYEIGTEIGLFNNRLRFDGTYYTLDNRNQILPIGLTPSTGYSSKNINVGLVNSKGWELMLGVTPIDNNGWKLDLTANFTKNTTTIKELAPGMPYFPNWTDAKGGSWTYVGEEIGGIYDSKLVTVEDKNSPYYGYPILDDEGSWQVVSASNGRNKIGNYNPDFLMGLQTSLSYKNFTLNMTFDWRQGGDFVSQTYRYSESDLKTQRFLDQLINPGSLQGDDLRDWLVANQDRHITDGINIVGGPTKEYGGVPLTYDVTLNDGVFNPGVIAQYDDDGNIVGYTENLGGDDTKYIPYADNYPWDMTKPALFSASFIKLREISLAYQLPQSFIKSLRLQNATVSIYSRNIMLWTKAKIGIDPETAYQVESGVQGNNIQFKQGIERYNVTPWVMPVGFKIGLTF